MKSLLFACIASLTLFTSFGQQLESVLMEQWANNEWVNRKLKSNTYSDGLISFSTEKRWNVHLDSWLNFSQIRYIRDGKDVKFLFQDQWDSSDSSWKELLKTSIKRNEKGQAVEKIIKKNNPDGWTNISKTVNNYNDKEQLHKITSLKWKSDQNQFIPETKLVYTFDEEGTVIEIISHQWSIHENEWLKLKRSRFIYNGEKLIFKVYDLWKNGLWAYDSKTEKLYNEETEITKSITSNFDPKTEISHNEVAYYYLRDAEDHVEMCLAKAWNAETESWTNHNRAIYNYSKRVNHSGENYKIKIWPNPTTIGRITLGPLPKGTVTIFNILGKQVRNIEKDEIPSLTINVSDLPEGAYFVRLDGLSIGTFMKQ